MKKNIKLYLKTFINAILAGIAIAIGGWLYIKTRSATNNTVLASCLFSIGLILICNFGYFLYTGKICYLPKNAKDKNTLSYSLQLVIGLIGNYIGATLMGLIISKTLDVPSFVNSMVDIKINYEWWKLIILGMFCGMLIYFAVEGFAKINNNFGKYVVLILCVGGFIICGFEHCIADIFYFSVAGNFSLEAILSIILIVVGNTIGGMIVPVLGGLHD